jgi:MFS family permease
VWANTDWTLRRALRTARFWWISLGYFCGLYIWYAVQVHQTKFLLDVGFSANVAVWALGVVSLLGIPGQIWLGHLSDRIGREWIWAISCLGFAICFAALIALKFAPVLPLVYLMIFTQGALGYGLTSIMGAVVLEIFQGKQYGSIFGTIMLARWPAARRARGRPAAVRSFGSYTSPLRSASPSASCRRLRSGRPRRAR